MRVGTLGFWLLGIIGGCATVALLLLFWERLLVSHFDLFSEVASVVNPAFGPLGVILAFFAANRSHSDDEIALPFAVTILVLTLIWMLIIVAATTGFVWTTWRDLHYMIDGPAVTKDALDDLINSLSKFQAIIVAAVALAFGADAAKPKENS